MVRVFRAPEAKCRVQVGRIMADRLDPGAPQARFKAMVGRDFCSRIKIRLRVVVGCSS